MTAIPFGAAMAFIANDAGALTNGYPDVLTAAATAGSVDTSDGLLVGSATAGIGETGLNISRSRQVEDRSPVGASFTRPISELLRVDGQLSVACAFCGNRATLAGAPGVGDFDPIPGLHAMLRAAGMDVETSDATKTNYKFVSAGSDMGALIYAGTERLKLVDVALSAFGIAYTPAGLAVLTATLEIGSFLAVESSAFPTIVVGNQTVKSPTVQDAAFTWGMARSFNTLTIGIANDIQSIPASNEATGLLKEADGRTTTLSATMWEDDADDLHNWDQLNATGSGDLSPLSFGVGTAATGATDVVERHRIVAPEPELLDDGLNKLGSKKAGDVNIRLANDSANEELEIIFE